MHFHVGPGKDKLSLLHTLLERCEIPPRHLYPTHVSRNEQLLDDAISLAARGCFEDMDNVECGLANRRPIRSDDRE